jgi:ketosteroid isomerase-like protein
MKGEPRTSDLEDIARRSFAAFAHRDVDRATADYAPDIVWDMSALGMGVYEGFDATRAFLRDWLSPFEDYDQEVEEFRDLGNGVTLAVALQRGRPAGGSGFVEVRYAGVNTWAGNRIQRVSIYTDLGEARAAAEQLAEERRTAAPDASSPDPLVLFRQGFEAINRRDFDALMSSFTTDAVWDFTDWGIGTFDGRASVRGFFEDWQGNYDAYHAEPDELLDLGYGVIFVAYRERARPAGSHAEVEWQRGYVALVRDGLIERVTFYTGAEAARAAARELAEARG